LDFPGAVFSRSRWVGNDDHETHAGRDGALAMDRVSSLPRSVSPCLEASFETHHIEESIADRALPVNFSEGFLLEG
jgi:hypothetical protein